MFKKIAIALLAAAATGTLALTAPAAAASPGPYDQSDQWGPVHARHHLAKAKGWVGVEWDEHQESNTVHVKGRLYDLDSRGYGQGGRCAYVRFQAAGFDHEWDEVYSRKHCGYPGSKKFGFSVDDVSALRVKVCQVHPYKHWVSKCGHWDHLYAAESE
ncbi:hypothetical protein [Nonomuraea sp. NPDC003214]